MAMSRSNQILPQVDHRTPRGVAYRVTCTDDHICNSPFSWSKALTSDSVWTSFAIFHRPVTRWQCLNDPLLSRQLVVKLSFSKAWVSIVSSGSVPQEAWWPLHKYLVHSKRSAPLQQFNCHLHCTVRSLTAPGNNEKFAQKRTSLPHKKRMVVYFLVNSMEGLLPLNLHNIWM